MKLLLATTERNVFINEGQGSTVDTQIIHYLKLYIAQGKGTSFLGPFSANLHGKFEEDITCILKNKRGNYDITFRKTNTAF